MKIIFKSLLLFFLLAMPAHAACYGDDEAAAEAAVRIHSELMVTALTCQYGSGGQNLTKIYNTFGQKHRDRLRRAEQTLIKFYRSNGEAGTAKLDSLRTALGNEYAEKIASRDPLRYCKAVGDMVVQASRWNPAQFEQAILRAAASPATQPSCVQTAER